MKNWRCAAAAAAGTLVLVMAGAWRPAAAAGERGLERVPGSHIVALAETRARDAVERFARARGASVRYAYAWPGPRLNVRGLPAAALEALARLPGVLEVTPDYRVRASLVESVPLVGALTADVESIDPSVNGGRGTAICVLDTGINPGHFLFDEPGKIVGQFDFIDHDDVAQDDNGHGSHVAAIAAGRESPPGLAAVQGVAPGASLLIGKVLGADGIGAFSDLQAGIEWCLGNGADIVNLSLGAGQFQGSCDASDPTGTAQLINALAGTMLFVSAAGNQGFDRSLETPACATGSMAIGATYDAAFRRIAFPICTDRGTGPDQRACFSNRSAQLDAVAPGCIIDSADGMDAAALVPLCGTSQSAPHVSGLAALLMAQGRFLVPQEVAAQIERSSLDLGLAGFDRLFGNGRIDVRAALGPLESCGNGMKRGGEQCDGADLGGKSCATLVGGPGQLACRLDCTFDFTGCANGEPVCGDGTCQFGEDCLTCRSDCPRKGQSRFSSCCGDGVCERKEKNSTCFIDCQ